MNKKTFIVSLLAVAVLVGSQAVLAKEQVAHKENKKSESHQEVKAHTSVAPSIPSNTSLEIGQNGRVNISDARVMNISGSVITATTSWGGFTMVWTINVNGNTNFNARYGGVLNLENIAPGDHISVKATITGNGPTVLASAITDLSMQRRNATFLGTITSINSGAQSFVVNTKERGSQTILVSSSTKFLGTLNNFSALTIGAKVQTSGIWNSDQNSLQAAHVLISKEKQNEERVFQGTIKSVNASTTPQTVVVHIENSDQTVTLAADTVILNFSWQHVPLTAFKVGDILRVYGIGQDLSIGATVVRDISLK
ncbi:MAG: DUF5666 domain-containing protein [Patescibacteria group bacterium]